MRKAIVMHFNKIRFSPMHLKPKGSVIPILYLLFSNQRILIRLLGINSSTIALSDQINFTLNFDVKKNVAIMQYGLNKKQKTVEVGLDGVYRITEFPEKKVAFKGKWLKDDTFKFSVIDIGHTEGSSGEIKFTENRADTTLTFPYGRIFRLKGVREQ